MATETAFDESFKITKLALKLTGVNLDQPSGRNFREYVLDTWVFFFNALWMYTDVLGEIYWFIEGIRLNKTFSELTFIAPCIVIGFLSNSKTVAVVASKDLVRDLLEKFNHMHPDEADQDEVVDEAKQVFDFVVKLLFYLNIFLMASFCIVPLFIISITYYKSGELKLMTPFIIKYPFDPLDLRVWPLVYLHQCWSCVIATASIVGCDSLFCSICIQIQMHFRLLRRRIEDVVVSSMDSGDAAKLKADYVNKWQIEKVNINEELLRGNFMKLVQEHKELIALVDVVENIYTKAIFFNFVTSSFMICLTGFNATTIENTVLVVAFIMFLLTSLSQIFLTCYFGDMIVRASVEVSDGIYHSHWYLASLSIRKSMLIVQTRAQKPCRLTAVKYTEVNLRALSKILSTSWSYFALLKTVYSGNR